MRRITSRIITATLAILLSGGMTAPGSLRAPTVSSTGGQQQEEKDSQSKEGESKEAAPCGRSVKPRVRYSCVAALNHSDGSLMMSARYRPTLSSHNAPDSQADLRNGIGAPLLC
jgi:hypothetical protein